MADETKDAAPSSAPANEPARPERYTLGAYAKKAELPAWQLAQLCAVTKHGPDDEIAPDAIAKAVEFLNSMTLGG